MRFRFGEFELDDKRFTLAGSAGPVHVEPQVFEVLHHLIRHRDRVVSKEELLDAVWGDRFVSESALTSRIKAARQAVGDDGQAQSVIKTAHGRGYQFVAALRVEGERDRRTLPRLRNAPLGRDHDIVHVRRLASEVGMVTITGAGGIGKTTLALAVADGLDGVPGDPVFVDLSPLAPGTDVGRAVADAAGLEGAASETLEGVAEHLARHPGLLILDNCEHVLASAAQLTDRMLRTSDSARVLATSREPLGVAGEHVWPLGPLHEDGPALFVERARAAEPRVDWAATDPAVVELCRRLDHVPLALELAAGQLRRFDLAELTQRLNDRLVLLSSTGSAEGRRHATMETAIDWSYQLLDGSEQRLLRSLSVFPSWFDSQGVEASAPTLDEEDAVTVFGQLVDKSLVVRQPGTARYRLLETIRMFARDRLEDADETAAAFERHRRAVRDRLAATSRTDRWLSARLAAAFRSQLDDARQAFRRSIEQGEIESAVEIAIGGSFLWRNAMGCTEGAAWVDELRRLVRAPDDQLWVDILRADVGQGRGDHRQMFDAASAAAGLVDAGSDPGGASLAAHYGALAHLTDPTRARETLGRARELAVASCDERLVTLIDSFLAVASLAAGEHDDTRREVARLDGVASEDGYDRFIVHWTGWLLALAEYDCDEARRWMAQQQDYLDRTGIVETWITSFSTAMCDVIEGTDVRSTTLARTLRLAEQEGYDAGADCVLALAYAEMCGERYEVAAELMGVAIRGRFNATAHYVLYRAVLDRLLRQQLDEATMEAALHRGRTRAAAEVLASYGI